ncbi:MAG: hypothetical protein HY453_01110 [Parcubacteria group bacterium]|nr:hypothetical protein [Parcubacteria group bacterium]
MIRIHQEPKQSGFTLIELIIYTLLVSGIMVTLTNLALDIVSASQKARAKQEVQQNARLLMNRILYEIRTANDLNTGSSTFDTHPGVLSLAKDSGSLDPTVFDVSAGVSRITQGVGSAVELTSDKVTVTNLVFKNKSISGRTKNIKIEITVQHKNPDGRKEYNVSASVQSTGVIRERED